jgi:guanylate kinase
MKTGMTGRLVILSGPSCVGKTPLHKALVKFHPELQDRLQKLVLFNSRRPRPGEKDGVDYHFRPRKQIEGLKKHSQYAVLEVRNDLQALDIEELQDSLKSGDVLFEGNPAVGRTLQTHAGLAAINKLGIFLSPLSREEVLYLRSPEHNLRLSEFVTDVMRRKLLRRTRRQKGELSLHDLEDVETRASSAYRELQEGWHFEHIIPNHDGEDSDNWDAFYFLIGDARQTLEAFHGLLNGERLPIVETWEEGLLPSQI